MTVVVAEIASAAELQALCSGHAGLTAVLLWAPWHPPSAHLTKVLDAIAAKETNVRFGKVNTDVCSTMAEKMGANQVPFVAFFDRKGNKLDSLAGADPPKLVEMVKRLAARPMDVACAGSCTAGEDTNAKLKRLVNFSPVMLFMKGSKIEPFCKFSKQAVALLNESEADYSTFDILQDNDVREGLKEYSNWKTYPQLYIQGELMGGIDVMKEMNDDGSLKEALSAIPAEDQTLEDRLKSLINQAPVMLFMKGNPEEPRCGFSRKIVELLKEQNLTFSTFDILGDNDVREGLKTFSNWQTFPQLYGSGKLVGGLDIVKELAEEGALTEELGIKGAKEIGEGTGGYGAKAAAESCSAPGGCAK